jgi:hypothetical protein
MHQADLDMTTLVNYSLSKSDPESFYKLVENYQPLAKKAVADFVRDLDATKVMSSEEHKHLFSTVF